MSSSNSEKKNTDSLAALAQEVRQFNGLGASLFRVAAARIGMTATDIQVIDLLETTSSVTAGQLSELTGLTTGAITAMLNRLEEAGLVRRERDASDGRRVIVRLEKNKDELREVSLIFDSFSKAWAEMATHYDDAQLALLTEFLKHGNTLARKQIMELREAPTEKGMVFSAPLGDLESARLVVSSGVSKLTLRADEAMSELYQARFEEPLPDVKVKEGVVTIRYPKRLWVMMGGGQHGAEVTLNVSIPWRIVIQGGLSQVEALLSNLNLAGLEVKGGLSTIRLELPVPSSMVPIQLSGGASEIIVQRPANVAARIHLKGWSSQLIFDGQTYSNLGNDVRLQSPGFNVTNPGYDIEVASSVSTITITSS